MVWQQMRGYQILIFQQLSQALSQGSNTLLALQGALIVPMQCSSGPRSLNVIQQDDFCIVICMSVFLHHCHYHHQFEEKSI